jgi:GT2 family glycosyltransferase
MTLDPRFDCSVVIVNYRTEAPLEACLRSLPPSESREVIVVDNSQTLRRDGFPARFPGVIFMESPENVGFAAASNRGLAEARGRHLLLLNPDTLVHGDAIEALEAALDRDPRVGAVGPRLLNDDGSLQYSCRRFPSYLTIFFGRYSLFTKLLPGNPISRRYLYLDWAHDTVAEVDWVSGACLMVRREVLEKIGPLDPGYFLFVEDMDWCRRIRDAGYSVLYTPEATVTHRVGASRARLPPRVVFARHRGMLRYVHKHFHSPWPVEAILGAGLLARASLEVLTNAFRGLR